MQQRGDHRGHLIPLLPRLRPRRRPLGARVDALGLIEPGGAGHHVARPVGVLAALRDSILLVAYVPAAGRQRPGSPAADWSLRSVHGLAMPYFPNDAIWKFPIVDTQPRHRQLPRGYGRKKSRALRVGQSRDAVLLHLQV